MRKLLISVCLACLSLSVFAQRADMRIGELLNRSDWFALEEEYPALKDSVQTEFLKVMAEVMIGNFFNQPEQAIASINLILQKHQQEIGFENACTLVALSTILEGERGNYAEAADKIENFISQLKEMGMDNVERYEGIFQKYNKLRSFPAPTVSRPGRDVEVPISIDPVRLPKSVDPQGVRGLHIHIPVTVHGKEYQFIFDTGAAGCYMSERFAKEVGVRIDEDSTLLNKGELGESYGMGGYLDSMQIGGITFRNAIVAVAKPNAAVDSVIRIDAVLGMDFMKLVEEIQIYPDEKKILFPAKLTPPPATGRNLLLTNANKPILKTHSDKERLNHDIAGSGEIQTDGSLWMDLIKQYSKVTINLKDMFVELE